MDGDPEIPEVAVEGDSLVAITARGRRAGQGRAAAPGEVGQRKRGTLIGPVYDTM